MVICGECGKDFSKAYNLKRHQTTSLTCNVQNNIVENNFACSECYKKFNRRDTLERHQKSVHPKRVKEGKQFLRVQQYFECNYCNKKFLRKDTLIRHIQCGHLFESDVFECSHCSRKYTRKNDLANHISECFNYKIADCPEVKHFKCLFCKQDFDTRKCINDHYQKDHSIMFQYEQLEVEQE